MVSQNFPEFQTAINRVTLSLDSFLLNGIPCGVIQAAVFNGFLEKTAHGLLNELANLEEQLQKAPETIHFQLREVMARLRATCQQLIEVVTGLQSFRTLPLQQLRSTVSQIQGLHERCVHLVQELESDLRAPKSLASPGPYQPKATVTDFLADLERIFAEEWAGANAMTESASPARAATARP